MEKTSEKDSMVQKSDVMEKDDAMMVKGESMEKSDVMVKSGNYEVYEQSKLAVADTGDVVLFFHASWCPTCRALDANIKANSSSIPEDLTILDVDYDTYSDLKKKYGVRYQHTLVQVDSKGNLIKKWSGSPTLSSIVEQVI